MKRFRFNLEQLLRVKKQRERLAEVRLYQARVAVDVARARVDELKADLTHQASQLEGLLGKVLASDTWAANFEHTDRLVRAVYGAEEVLTVALARYEEARHLRTQIATEVEVLNTLRDQQWDVHQQDTLKAEQQRLDELGMRRWKQAARK